MKEEAFIKRCGISVDKSIALPRDASTKSFYRLYINQNNSPEHFKGIGTALLMHYPNAGEVFDKFLEVAKIFSHHGLRCPYIFDYDSECILLEDFGDTSINKFLANRSSKIKIQTYTNIVQDLYKLQQISTNEFQNASKLSKETLLRQLSNLFPWYLRYLNKSEDFMNEYIVEWQKILNVLPNLGEVPIHGDFHVDNLFILPNNKIGIIDFQDLSLGHPVYDLVSLLSDARIEVENNLKTQMLDLYIKLTNFDPDKVKISFDILGAQNCSRILGLFAKKALKDGDIKYLKFIPRLERYLYYHLKLPKLNKIAKLMLQHAYLCAMP
ncbi:Putative aminoglycoside phosphotransferase [Candidatus Phycorickettsia trachydisci]|uniref:Aminoglycoside phosphotransferase n=1 Tax=Candidatus Phycorickettsia trachydisci TaxID=2115978 RepID=A0A2P1P851_9RICK|nr:phosphotransferase [Candidatus Phycorickettsia trachydisci]AVP87436.1 Putative aminoglycoside phosphotransferase [Candidatus Phycorickettsia trachydisci]